MIPAIAAVAVMIAAIGLYMLLRAGGARVNSIAVSKWMLTDEGYSADHYAGLVTSDESRPFAAVISDGDGDVRLVFMDGGEGTVQISVPSDEDPSLACEIEGYMTGKTVRKSDFEEITYSGSDYYDWDMSSLDPSYSDYTSCIVDIEAVMKKNATGILIYDVEDNINQTVEQNDAMAIVNGVGRSAYISDDLPYKSRGMEDITVIPRFFCAAEKLDNVLTSADSSFVMDREETSYTSLSNTVKYSGTMNLVLSDYSNGFIVYTATQTAGGEADERGAALIRYARVYPGGRFSLKTHNSYDIDAKVSEPEYEFHIAGFLAWTELGQD